MEDYDDYLNISDSEPNNTDESQLLYKENYEHIRNWERLQRLNCKYLWISNVCV